METTTPISPLKAPGKGVPARSTCIETRMGAGGCGICTACLACRLQKRENNGHGSIRIAWSNTGLRRKSDTEVPVRFTFPRLCGVLACLSPAALWPVRLQAALGSGLRRWHIFQARVHARRT